MVLIPVVAIREWISRTRTRILVGLGESTAPERDARQSETLLALLTDSRLVSLLESWIAATSAAGRNSLARKTLSGAAELNLSGRVRLAGWALVVAVIAHALFFLLFQMTVTWIGWTARILLLALGLILFSKPRMWASAWLDRRG